MNNWNLKGKKALVTGGSKGIGKAAVRELAELGAEVLFTARNENELMLASREFENEGLLVHTIAGDTSDDGHRKALSEWISINWQQLDILVNNAGINLRKPTNDYTATEYQQVLQVNMIAPFELSRLLFPLLEKATSPSIINVASVAGSFDAGTGSPYGMSKGGLIQMTKNLAAEWAEAGIRVNAVSPWYTETPLSKSLLTQPEKLQKIILRTPMKRIAKDYEIAATIAFLAMDKAAYITGQNISVDGGATISIL